MICHLQKPADAPCSYALPKFPVADQQTATFSLRGSFVSVFSTFTSLLASVFSSTKTMTKIFVDEAILIFVDETKIDDNSDNFVNVTKTATKIGVFSSTRR